jgi:hypothetical protein
MMDLQAYRTSRRREWRPPVSPLRHAHENREPGCATAARRGGKTAGAMDGPPVVRMESGCTTSGRRAAKTAGAMDGPPVVRMDAPTWVS